MKKYIAPEMDIVKFSSEDIITTSVTEPAITRNSASTVPWDTYISPSPNMSQFTETSGKRSCTAATTAALGLVVPLRMALRLA